MVIHIIEPWTEILPGQDFSRMLQDIERAGRTCYKSEDKITDNSARRFVAVLMKNHHYSLIEHASVRVKFIVDRGVSHELVRHRLASFSQESTRYCNYEKKGLTFIRPFFFQDDSEAMHEWECAMSEAANRYLNLLQQGRTPQEARSVLPNSLKTELVVTANLREWRCMFQQRTAKDAHPQMRQVMVPLLEGFQALIPVVFDDL